MLLRIRRPSPRNPPSYSPYALLPTNPIPTPLITHTYGKEDHQEERQGRLQKVAPFGAVANPPQSSAPSALNNPTAMIDPKELRIGNYYYSVMDKGIHPILIIFDDENTMQPIPLTVDDALLRQALKSAGIV